MRQANEVLELVSRIMDRYQEVRKALSTATQLNWMASIADMQQQLDRLVFRGFLQHTPYPQLQRLPRYLDAIALRLSKLAHAAGRDQQLLKELQGLYQQWQRRDEKCRQRGQADSRLEEIRWAFEELRVSFFAQELKTAFPISLKRLETRWKSLGL